MDFSFLAKASGVIFRESFEAVLIYGIVVSYFQKQQHPSSGLKSAQWGLALGIIASLFVGVAFASALPALSQEMFSMLEIAIVFSGSLMMLYMVFWMSEQSKHLKNQIETGIRSQSSLSIIGTVFVAVFREGVEAVVYVYSLTFEKSNLILKSSIFLSVFIGVASSIVIYRLMLKGSQYLSMNTIFKISGFWLLISSSSLLAIGFDKLFAAGYFDQVSNPLLSFEFSESTSKITSFFESFCGIRFQPSLLHLISFLIFWAFIIYKDPLKLKQKRQTV